MAVKLGQQGRSAVQTGDEESGAPGSLSSRCLINADGAAPPCVPEDSGGTSSALTKGP